MSRSCSGFTLVELIITMGIIAILALATTPLAGDWVSASQTHAARAQLLEAFDMAKALALRNPNNVLLPGAAAGVSVGTNGTTSTALVCAGSAAAAGCVVGGANVQWSATYSTRVSTTINGVAVTKGLPPQYFDFDNRGEFAAGVCPIVDTSPPCFTLARGGIQNNETGTLY